MNPKQLKAYENKKKCERDMFCVKCNKIYKKYHNDHMRIMRYNISSLFRQHPQMSNMPIAQHQKDIRHKKAVHGCAFGVLSKNRTFTI